MPTETIVAENAASGQAAPSKAPNRSDNGNANPQRWHVGLALFVFAVLTAMGIMDVLELFLTRVAEFAHFLEEWWAKL